MTEKRNVLVTGGNRGIGLAIARRFAQQGDNVVIATRSGQGVDDIPAVTMDVADSDSVNEGFKSATDLLGGPMDIVVANAGITDDGLLMRMSDDSFDKVIETNLVGAFRCARAASTGMLRRKNGRIVFISSVVGLYGGPGQANYAAAKSGLVGLARSIARELGGRGITANVVAPGFIETEMTAALPAERQQQYKAAIPAGRFAHPSEVAAAVTFLASPEAGYINGAVIPVDGGLGMGH